MELYINPLSANGQCQTMQESESLIKTLYEAIRFCHVLVDSENLIIFYDSHMECREIILGQSFQQTIGNIRPDVRRLWYIYKTKYTKNLVAHTEADSIIVRLNGSVFGSMHVNLFDNHKKWLSFHCTNLLIGKMVVSSQGASKNIYNFCNIENIKSIVRRIQPRSA